MVPASTRLPELSRISAVGVTGWPAAYSATGQPPSRGDGADVGGCVLLVDVPVDDPCLLKYPPEVRWLYVRVMLADLKAGCAVRAVRWPARACHGGDEPAARFQRSMRGP